MACPAVGLSTKPSFARFIYYKALTLIPVSTAFRATIPRYEDREGVIDVTGDGVLRTPGAVLLRAFLPFRFWPLGGWAAYGAWHRESDEKWTFFNEEELRNVW